MINHRAKIKLSDAIKYELDIDQPVEKCIVPTGIHDPINFKESDRVCCVCGQHVPYGCLNYHPGPIVTISGKGLFNLPPTKLGDTIYINVKGLDVETTIRAIDVHDDGVWVEYSEDICNEKYGSKLKKYDK